MSMAAAALDSGSRLRWRGARADGGRTAPRWERRPQLERLRLASDVTCALVDMGLGFVAAAAIRHCWPTVDGALARPHFHVGETQLQELVLWLKGVDFMIQAQRESQPYIRLVCLRRCVMEAALGAAAGLLRVGPVPPRLFAAVRARRSGSASPDSGTRDAASRALHIAMASVYTVPVGTLVTIQIVPRAQIQRAASARGLARLRHRAAAPGDAVLHGLDLLLPTVAAYYTLATVLRAAASACTRPSCCACYLMAFPGFRFCCGRCAVAARRRSLFPGTRCWSSRGHLSSSRAHAVRLFFARLRSSVHMADFFTNSANPHAPAVLSVSRTATANSRSGSAMPPAASRASPR